MNANITETFKQELLDKVEIVDILSKFIYLQKKGNKYWGCCPFHGEKTPSFVVNPKEQYYHCFGCGVSGNVITFLMEYQKMSYQDAIIYLAETINMKIPEKEETEEEKNARLLRDSALKLLRDVALYYVHNLYETNGKVALDYLLNRKLSLNTIKKFGLGYSTDFNSLPKYLFNLGYTKELMLYAGVCEEKFDKLQDFLGGRVIVPIINAKGQVIAFGGRLLEKKDFAKYKNTAGTKLFDKRKNLFAINFAKENKTDYLILTEGYMDVIMLYQSGFTNSIASMGTALTAEQCVMIKRYVSKIYVSFDGDFAGTKATLRSLDMLQSEGLDVKIIELEEGLDPDDTIKKYGVKGYQFLIDNALPIEEYRLKLIEKKNNISTLDGKKNYAKESVKFLTSLDPITRNIYVKKVSEVSNISETTILNELTAEVVKERVIFQGQKPENANIDITKAEEKGEIEASRCILASVVLGKEYVTFNSLKEEYFAYPPHKTIFEYILGCIKNQKQSIIGELYNLEGVGAELNEILKFEERIPLPGQEKFYQDSLKRLDKKLNSKRMKEILSQLQIVEDENDKKQLEKELVILSKK